MSDTGAQEIPLVFECEGEQLVGVVHRPEQPGRVGVLAIIAGGPQYRGGVGRGMVTIARALCEKGVPLMRFDYRGMGDSGGEFQGFEAIAEDLQSAVDAFMHAVPELEKVVLWGGCDAASGAMIHGWKIPQAASLVLGNPWVYTPQIASAVRKQHYLKRLTDLSFWRKVVRMEYDFSAYARAGFRKVASRFAPPKGGSTNGAAQAKETFVDRMLAGLQRFEGPVLFLLSGQSIVSTEFDQLIAGEKGWAEVYQREGTRRVDLPDADQTFSTADDREQLCIALCDWLDTLSQP